MPASFFGDDDDGAMTFALIIVIIAALFVVQRGPRAARWLVRKLNIRGARLRAGCIPVRVRPSGQIDVLLARPRQPPAVLTLPGGRGEGGGSAHAAASDLWPSTRTRRTKVTGPRRKARSTGGARRSTRRGPPSAAIASRTK